MNTSTVNARLLKPKNNTEKTYELLLMLDSETVNHSFRVGDLAAEIFAEYAKGRELGLDYGPDVIRFAGLLHDVGKLRVPATLLSRPGRLNDGELALVRRHPIYASKVLDDYLKRADPVLKRVVLEVAAAHHERIDGSGYPRGLSGDAISLAAQTVGLANCYDSLISVRTYRTAKTKAEALKAIRGGACGGFDKELVDCLAALVTDRDGKGSR